MTYVDTLRASTKWKAAQNMRNRAVPGDSRPVPNKAYTNAHGSSPYGRSAQLIKHRKYPNPIKHWRKRLFPRHSSGASTRRVQIPYNSPGSAATVRGIPTAVDPSGPICDVTAAANRGLPPTLWSDPPNNSEQHVAKPNLQFYADKAGSPPTRPLYLQGPGYPGHNGRPCCNPESNVIRPTAGMNTKRINPIAVQGTGIVVGEKYTAAPSYLTNAYAFDTAGYLKNKGKSFVARQSGIKVGKTNNYRSLYASELGHISYGKGHRPPARSKCCDVIVKPNNPQFFTQGAVDSSSRIERLKYNTLTSKSDSSSFTTAWAKAADNAGRYRTNGNGPYFMKNKATICRPQNYARFNKVCDKKRGAALPSRAAPIPAVADTCVASRHIADAEDHMKAIEDIIANLDRCASGECASEQEVLEAKQRVKDYIGKTEDAIRLVRST